MPTPAYSYHYTHRDAFEAKLIESDYAPTTAQVYATALVNESLRNHPRAKKLWKRFMGSLPFPQVQETTRASSTRNSTPRNSSSRRVPMKLDASAPTPVLPPAPTPTPTVEPPKPTSTEPKVDVIKTILNLSISDELKVAMIALLF